LMDDGARMCPTAPRDERARPIRTNSDERGASFRRAEVPFKSARATCSNRPTGLADGLELESTPTRNGESAPRHSRVANALGPPLQAIRPGLGYTVTTIERGPAIDQEMAKMRRKAVVSTGCASESYCR